MRLPAQAIPVIRSAGRSRPAARLGLSNWAHVASCVDSFFTASGVSACLTRTNSSAFISCATALMQKKYDIVSSVVVRQIAECALHEL